jgi:hypothetical protein
VDKVSDPKAGDTGSLQTEEINNARNHHGSSVILAAEVEPYHFCFPLLIVDEKWK